MTTNDPITLVNNALSKGELDKLLLGAPEYCYRSHWSPAPGNTDLTELLGAIHDKWDPNDMEKLKNDLTKALYLIVDTYEGIEPVVTCILLESIWINSKNKSPIGLPLEDLAKRLQMAIRIFTNRLVTDKTGMGAQWSDGQLGDLRRLNRIITDEGGPSFMP